MKNTFSRVVALSLSAFVSIPAWSQSKVASIESKKSDSTISQPNLLNIEGTFSGIASNRVLIDLTNPNKFDSPTFLRDGQNKDNNLWIRRNQEFIGAPFSLDPRRLSWIHDLAISGDEDEFSIERKIVNGQERFIVSGRTKTMKSGYGSGNCFVFETK